LLSVFKIKIKANLQTTPKISSAVIIIKIKTNKKDNPFDKFTKYLFISVLQLGG